MKTQRYTICGDDSGHEYYIPVEQVDQFYAWVSSFNDDGDGPEEEAEYVGPDFDANRIDGRFTFTDPKCK